MKKILLITGIIFSLAACNSMLEEEVFDQVTTNNFFHKERDVKTAVNGVYDGIQDLGLWQHMSILGDGLPGALGHYWNRPFVTLTFEDNNNYVWNPWMLFYNTIGRANIVLEALGESSLDEALKNRYEGEVRFVRAYSYFNLVRMYGHIPLVTKAPESLDDVVLPDTTQANETLNSEFFVQRDRNDVYDFIIEDLKAAEEFLPESYNESQVGRATKGAAAGLLAKVYLTLARKYYDYSNGTLAEGDAAYYAKALEQCEKVKAMGYSLEENFADVFSPENEIENSEMIFAIKYIESAVAGVEGEGNQMNARFGVRNGSITPYAWKQRFANDMFYDDFVAANGADDPRVETTFLTRFIDGEGDTVKVGDMSTFVHPHVKKFLSDLVEGPNDQPTAQSATDYGTDYPILRYADVLLMHSEILNEMGSDPNNETIFGINQVRERVGKAPVELPVSKEELRDIIFDERKWELAYEGQYYFDCKRYGNLLEEIAKSPERKVEPNVRHYILPIPYNAMQANPTLVQNAGW